MNEINLFDNIFSHQVSSSDTPPTNFRYIKENINFDGITIFTDNYLKTNIVDRVNSKYKIGWLSESKSVVQYSLSDIIRLSEKFDFIFTHDKRLIDYNPEKFLFVIPASWRAHFPDNDVNFYENKTKLVSFAFSNKIGTKGHKYRHSINSILGEKMDTMGTGTSRPFDQHKRVLAYQDYMFTLIIENDNYDYYYSEKIMEPYWAGTIPIYWGGSHNINLIEKVFGIDPNGIILFENEQELENILNNLSENLYQSKIESVKKNYDIFTDKIYRIGSEEYFYEKYLHKFFEEGNLNGIKSFVV
jgi:hypothetical protein